MAARRQGAVIQDPTDATGGPRRAWETWRVDLTESPELPPVALRLDWAEHDANSALPANQFIAQVGLPSRQGPPDGIYVTFGHVTPPVLLGPTPEELQNQIEELGGTRTVRSLGSYLLSRGRLDELIEVLQTAARQYDSFVEHQRTTQPSKEAGL
jgi:hypothetical protein